MARAILTRPDNTLTGPQAQALDLLIDAIAESRDYTLWGVEDDCIVYDDPHSPMAGNSKTVRKRIRVQDPTDPDVREVSFVFNSAGRLTLDPEKITQPCGWDDALRGETGGDAQSKYELIDGAWHRTEFNSDAGFFPDRSELDTPIPVAFVDVVGREVVEFGVGDARFEYR